MFACEREGLGTRLFVEIIWTDYYNHYSPSINS